jgi:hypothetical protein
MTEEQIEAHWEFVEMLFRLPPTKPARGPAKA